MSENLSHNLNNYIALGEPRLYFFFLKKAKQKALIADFGNLLVPFES